ncbi:hypothetical protein CANTEDRAFT_111283 [Yamadazyma tenuis ATCC 10573]|uniref:Uncharacterized protein n=1 Tax=Candida tenuis (strain ATCC 10573 / BCRC 21748 / CBS 615 / JCM 9827 / NBRC 10315 / NRRL Y-1498 / VKM Y-70) TaxID=590646 RepID=G3BCW8_CANTC|nr:uncharacterized protein CANTEDRAFT_111283 [Yamadazyma tenuis ATCC 10573]EGV60227.1 hypothetical protein CANTEDRAFT_111283 [Yamadazyma tenuis ATCC 10573]
MNSFEDDFNGKTMNFQEQQRRQVIMNTIENHDYLLVVASQQNKTVEQVKYELMMKLMRKS